MHSQSLSLVTLHLSRNQSGPGSWAWGQLSTCLRIRAEWALGFLASLEQQRPWDSLALGIR